MYIRERERETDRQTDRDREKERQTDRQTDKDLHKKFVTPTYSRLCFVSPLKAHPTVLSA